MRKIIQLVLISLFFFSRVCFFLRSQWKNRARWFCVDGRCLVAAFFSFFFFLFLIVFLFNTQFNGWNKNIEFIRINNHFLILFLFFTYKFDHTEYFRIRLLIMSKSFMQMLCSIFHLQSSRDKMMTKKFQHRWRNNSLQIWPYFCLCFIHRFRFAFPYRRRH